MPSLEWNEQVGRETAHLYERVKAVIPPVEWPFFAPYVKAINALKKERNAVILAHNYQTPEIYNCVADYVGDSLQLAREATKVDADIIVQGGVHFMAETVEDPEPRQDRADPGPARRLLARLLDHRRGRAAAAQEIPRRAGGRLRQHVGRGEGRGRHLLHVVERRCRWSRASTSDTVIFLPDQYLAKYVASQSKKKIIAWKGACEVHERFTGEELRRVRGNEPGVQIIAHPECPPDVLAEADYTGSTAGMIDWVRKHNPKRVVMVTECSMADNVKAELPDVEFVRPCNFCPHMKRITLPNILDSLVYLKEEVVIDPAIAARRGARSSGW